MRDLHYKHWLTTKSWFDFIPRIRVWGDFLGSKSNNWFRRSIYGMCERSRQFQSVDPIDNQNSWAYTKCNNIDQFVARSNSMRHSRITLYPNSILIWVITVGKSQEFHYLLWNYVNTSFIENRLQQYYSDPGTMGRISSTSHWGREKMTAIFRTTFKLIFLYVNYYSLTPVNLFWYQWV